MFFIQYNSIFFELIMNAWFTLDYHDTRSYSHRTRTELNRTRDKIVRMKKSYGNRTRYKIVWKSYALQNRTEIVIMTKSYGKSYACKNRTKFVRVTKSYAWKNRNPNVRSRWKFCLFWRSKRLLWKFFYFF